MDRTTLKSLQIFTNFGYVMGFGPYKFLVTSPLLSQKKDEAELRLEANLESTVENRVAAVNQTWIENNKKNDINHKEVRLLWIRKWIRNQLKKTTAFHFQNVFQRKVTELAENNWCFVIGSKYRCGIFSVSISLQGINTLFLIFRSIQSALNDEEKTKDKIKAFYLTGVLITVYCFQWLVALNFSRLPTYLNAVRETLVHVQKLELPQGTGSANLASNDERKKGRSVAGFIYAALILITFVALTRGTAVLLNPKSKVYVTSLSARPESLAVWVKILAAAFHFYVMGASLFAFYFLGATLVWFVVSMLPIIEKYRYHLECERNNDGGNEESQGMKKRLDVLYTSYNIVTVLNNNIKTVYGPVALLWECVTIWTIIFNLFLATVHGDLVAFFRACAVMYLQFVFFQDLAALHTESEEAIKTWGRVGTGITGQSYEVRTMANFNWFRKFYRSARSLRVYIGTFFFVDRRFILTLMAINIEQTTSLILSFK